MKIQISSTRARFGGIENKGFEMVLNLNPYRSADFNWDITANWSTYTSKVTDLGQDSNGTDIEYLALGSFQGGVSLGAKKGEEYGILRGRNFIYHENGQKLKRSNGAYQRTTSNTEVLGSIIPDWTGGIKNSFNYKDFNLSFLNDGKHSLEINDLALLPLVRWDIEMKPFWNIGEDGAHKRLTEFLDNGIANYKNGRNFPAKPFVSKISPHIHFGEISPNQAWYAAKIKGNDASIDHFLSELGWREFSYTQLYFNPELPKKNLQSKFDQFPWDDNSNNLSAWQQGQTGIPMVDAGMRELWLTGAMHNRVRMVVGSFLVKNLLLHWHHGERWFWDCLVDADLASNSASWQWIAGCGADAAPYFRIFNPVTQGEKFDSDGEYIRKYIPEIKALPNKYLFNPWEAPKEELDKAGITLGKDYPNPVIDLKLSRQNALEAFKSLKKVDD